MRKMTCAITDAVVRIRMCCAMHKNCIAANTYAIAKYSPSLGTFRRDASSRCIRGYVNTSRRSVVNSSETDDRALSVRLSHYNCAMPEGARLQPHMVSRRARFYTTSSAGEMEDRIHAPHTSESNGADARSSNRRKGKKAAVKRSSTAMDGMVRWMAQREITPKDLLEPVERVGASHRDGQASTPHIGIGGDNEAGTITTDPSYGGGVQPFKDRTGRRQEAATSQSNGVHGGAGSHGAKATNRSLEGDSEEHQAHATDMNMIDTHRDGRDVHENTRETTGIAIAREAYAGRVAAEVTAATHRESYEGGSDHAHTTPHSHTVPHTQSSATKEAVVDAYVHEHLRVAASSHNWFLMLQILSDLKDNPHCQGVDTEAMYTVMDAVKYMPLTDAVNVSRKLFQVCNTHIKHFRRLPDPLTKLEDLMETFTQIDMVYWAEQAFIWATDRPATKFIDKPRQRTYNLLLECISKRKSPLRVFDVVNEMKLRGISYNIDTVTYVFKDCYKRRRGDHALTFFNLEHVRERATADVYTLCMEALVHGRRLNPEHDDAVQTYSMLNEMTNRAFLERRKDLRPTLATYKVVYNVADLKGQNVLYKRLKADKIICDYEFICQRMDTLLDPQYPEVRSECTAMDVIDTFRDAQNRHGLFTDPRDGREDLGSEHWAMYEHGHYKLVQALSYLYMYHEATNVYASLVKQNIPLRSQTVSACLYAHAHARKWDSLGPILTRFWDQYEVAGPHLTRSLPDVCMMMAQERGKDEAFALWIHHQDMLNECVDPTWISRVQVATIDAMMNELNPTNTSHGPRHATRALQAQPDSVGAHADDDVAGVTYEESARQRRTASAEAVRHAKRMRQPGIRWHTYKKERRRLNVQVLHDKRIADRQALKAEWGVVDAVDVDAYERPEMRKRLKGDDKRAATTRHVPKWKAPDKGEGRSVATKGSIGGQPPPVVL